MLGAACRGPARAFGPDAATASANADQLFSAFAARYTSVLRDGRYRTARARFGQAALTPSKIFDDTTLWTGRPSPSTRTLAVSGTFAAGRYLLEARPSLPPLAVPGDGRHVFVLTRAKPDEYVWDTEVEFVIGRIQPDDVGGLLDALWSSVEGRGEHTLRAEYRALFPRTGATLGRLFTIESLAPVALDDGSTSTTLVLTMLPKEIEGRFPHFAKWLDKYVGRARYRFVLQDAGGVPWITAEGAEGRTTLRFRVKDGRLLPLTGGPRPVPGTFTLMTDFSTKVKVFTIGVRKLAAEVRLTNTPRERSFTIVARKEPEWRLPLVTERLIRSSLRHPFEGAGVVFALGVHDNGDGPSLITRRTHLAVQESGILRFLSGLTAHAVGEFERTADKEQEVFLHEVFLALRQDATAAARLAAAEP